MDQSALERRIEELTGRPTKSPLSVVTDSIPDIVMVLDQEMRIQAVNAGFSRLTGLDPSQVRGEFCYDVLCRRLAPPATDDAGCPLRRVFETGKRVELAQVSDHVKVPEIEQYFDVTMIREGSSLTFAIDSR